MRAPTGMSEDLGPPVCLQCGTATEAEPPTAWTRALLAWFLEGTTPRRQQHYQCPGCGAGAVTVFASSRRRPPGPVLFLRRLDGNRRVDPAPVFFSVVTAAGAVGGVLARRAGAPPWAPVAGALAATAAFRVFLWESALEPGARWRSLVEAWQDTYRGLDGGLERGNVRRIREAPFPLVGVADWEGTRRVGGHSFSGRFRLASVDLEHGDPDGAPFVSVQTLRRPCPTDDELADEQDEQRPSGQVTLWVDGRRWTLRRHAPLRLKPYDWAASGAVAGLAVAVQAVGVSPEELRLTVGVDPEPYLAGSRLWTADRTGSGHTSP